MIGLTDKKIKTLNSRGRYGDRIPTLYLLVKSPTRKTWVQRLTIEKTQHDLGLGPWPLVTVRRRSPEGDGQSPQTLSRREDHSRKTTSDRHHVPRSGGHRDRLTRAHMEAWREIRAALAGDPAHLCLPVYRTEASLRYHAGGRDDDARSHLDDQTGNREAGQTPHEPHVIKWAKAQGLRADDPTDGIIEALPKTATLKKGFKMIPHEQVAQAIATIQRSGASQSTILCFEFQVLTATRSSEVRLAEWSEIDSTKQMWTIPATRTKTRRAHRVPLSSRALAILAEARKSSRGNPLVFPSARDKPISDATISKLVRENGINGVPHAIARACFRSWCADVNVSREVAEACLAHVVKGVEGAYQRSDLFERRRSVMQKWSDYVTGAPSADVIPLHG